MQVEELIKRLPVTVVVAGEPSVVNGGYVSDLLSHVMGQARAGDVWVTLQGHQNIIAVASLVGIPAVIIAGGMNPDPDTIKKAKAEGITLMTSVLPVFEVVGLLHRLGISRYDA